jgi:hypothetical protein
LPPWLIQSITTTMSFSPTVRRLSCPQVLFPLPFVAFRLARSPAMSGC